MNVAEVRRLYEYDAWANGRMFDVAGELSDGQLDAPIISSFPSVRTTLAHIAGAEWIWVRRIFHGENPTAPPEWYTTQSLPELRARLAEVERERDAGLSAMSEERLGEVLAYRNMAGESKRQMIGNLLLHVVNHSTYHRGQLTTMLRQLGVKPPATDMMIFNAE